jgi:hypothetical protein
VVVDGHGAWQSFARFPWSRPSALYDPRTGAYLVVAEANPTQPTGPLVVQIVRLLP